MNSPVVTVNSVSIQAGTTLFIPSGPIGNHLFVVIDIKTIGGKQQALLASFETVVAKCDMSCVLSAGDHSFVQHPTFVGYSHCREDDIVDVEAHVKTGYFKVGVPVSAAVLAKVKTGYKNSNRVKRYIRANWG